jgi:predicted phage terminase large subunit-like protein
MSGTHAGVSSGPGLTIVSRSDLHREIEAAERLYNSTIRELVIDKNRIDVLAKEVLGYDLFWHHQMMLQHLMTYSWAMVLAGRGSGKTIMCQIVKSIHQILRDPNRRIIFASAKVKNAQESLEGVKQHLTNNAKFRAIFGDLVGTLWNTESITVKGRTRLGMREPTIALATPESGAASRHANDLHADDLWVEANSRTIGERNKVETFFWKTLVPTLEPDDNNVWITNTRYDPHDFGHTLGAPPYLGAPPEDCEEATRNGPMYGDKTLIIPAIYEDEDGQEHSYWPEKFSIDYLRLLRNSTDLGRIAFESQYQQNVRPMRGGGLIKYNDIVRFELKDMPQNLPVYLGVDLAIGESQKADEFWAVLGAHDIETGITWVYHRVKGRFDFARQRAIVVDLCTEHEVVRGIIETVGYQKALFGELKKDKTLPIVEHRPITDKYARIQRRTPLFENGLVHVAKGLDDLVDQMVSFTGERGKKDDGVDAWDYMIRAIQVRERKARIEPGLF